jgi:hypothetical protein
LPQPIFTPSTKAAAGDHDENIGFDRVVELVGADLAEQVRAATLALYAQARKLRRSARHHHRRHQVRVRPRRGRHPARHGRDPDPGFLALLARRRMATAGATRRPSTSSSCAITWRRWTGTRPRPARAFRPTIIEGTRAKYEEALRLLTA